MILGRRLLHHTWSTTCLPLTTRRWISAASLARRLDDSVQAYVSTSRDPYTNLSIEHYLLQNSSPASVILLQYINRPSIIIGRNQNPWLEVNLALLRSGRDRPTTEPPGLGNVDLVRRRSGGGTVFHDEGNVNWTVICPSAIFTRDKHVEMIVRALRSCGVDRARVNVRHDVVLDQGGQTKSVDENDTHVTPFTVAEGSGPRPLKVSGSAYKLTRGRALHHGTCLLSSPNLNIIPDYLHSPAKPFITARGVESVSSPVSNILLGDEGFSKAVQSQFMDLYAGKETIPLEEVGEELLEIESIRKGKAELESLEWTYLQTPQFTISNMSDTLRKFDLEMSLRYGSITSFHLAFHSDADNPEQTLDGADKLLGQRLHEISSWDSFLGPQLRSIDSQRRSEVCDWLEKMLPVLYIHTGH